MILAASIALPALGVALWLERRAARNRYLAAVRVCVLWSLAVGGVLLAWGGWKHFTLAIAFATAVLWCIPSAVWAYATLHSAWLRLRAAMHAIANTAILLVAFPAAVFSVFGGSWRVLFDQPNWRI